MKKAKPNQLLLALIFVRIGAVTFGGGLAMLPIIERELVHQRRWFTHDEYIDLITLARIAPGPIAVNLAVLVGHRLLGAGGAVLAAVAVALPSFVVIMALSQLLTVYAGSPVLERLFAGLRPAVLALVAGASLSLARPILRGVPALFSTGVALVLLLLGLHPGLVLVLGAAFGLVRSAMSRRARAREEDAR
ncbi:MAG: chromate transporter [Bacillota bacterium]